MSNGNEAVVTIRDGCPFGKAIRHDAEVPLHAGCGGGTCVSVMVSVPSDDNEGTVAVGDGVDAVEAVEGDIGEWCDGYH